jgi:hypothetical protein
MKLAVLLAVALFALTASSANAASEIEDPLDFCSKTCDQATDLFWDAYNSAVIKKKAIDDGESVALSARHEQIPEETAKELIRLSNTMYMKFGNQGVDRKADISGVVKSSCMEGCMEE